MARSYGNTKISTPRDTFNRVRRKDRKKSRPRPIINEETPMPDKYEGDIVFNKYEPEPSSSYDPADK